METVQIGDLVLAVAPDVAQPSEVTSASQSSKAKRKAESRRSISQSKLICGRAKMHGFQHVRLVGRGALIDQPMKLNGWLVMPPEMYGGIIPRDAWDAAITLTKGIAIKGFLIADDARSPQHQSQAHPARVPQISINWEKVARGVGWGVAAIAAAGAVISLLPLVLGIGALGIALAYDPLLIAVTAEDEWICLYEWWH